jgi:hypothetical protein
LPVGFSSNVIDAFATELLCVERVGPCARLVFAVPRQSGGSAFREPVAGVVVPLTALQGMARKLLSAPREIAEGQPDAAFESEEAQWSRPN